MGKTAIRLMMNLDEFERQVRFQPVNGDAGAAIACVDDDLQWLKRIRIHIVQQVVDKRRRGIEMAHAAGLSR